MAVTDSPGIDRRVFLKVLGTAGALVAGIDRPRASENVVGEEPFAVLVDTTRCIGCRTCEFVCAEQNGLPEPGDALSETQWSVVNRYDTERGEVFVKRQCMHCVQPACATACLTKAMRKTPEGPVVWRESKCMGCRFCMVSCPFDGPKFEYDSPVPKIQKCNLCGDRVLRGEIPACVENCPGEALLFGKRSEVLAEARRRICAGPDAYVQGVYGEHDAGGTSWLYLAAVPFERIGFRTDLGTVSYPELTRDFLYGVPVVLILVPAFLLALSRATNRELPPAEGATDEPSERD